MSSGDEEQRRENPGAVQEIGAQGSGGQQTPGAAIPSQDSIRRGEKLRELLQRRKTADPERSQQTGSGSLPPALAESADGGAEVNKADLNVGRRGGGAGFGAGGLGAGGGGQLRMALANRGAGGAVGQHGRALGAGGKGPGTGNSGMLMGRILQARQNRGGEGAGAGNPGIGMLRRILQARQDHGGEGVGAGQHAQQLSELQDQVSELRDRVQQLTKELERLRASQAVQPAASNSTTVAGTAKRKQPLAAKKSRADNARSGKDKL